MINYRVFFYIPNIVGYMRIMFLALALHSFGRSPPLTLLSYILSQALDALDGHLARLFSQGKFIPLTKSESAFGVFLDMITDRLSTTSLTAMLITLYPQHAMWLVFSIALDMGSHWAHMYTTLVLGEAHHKTAIMHFAPLRQYYSKKYIMAPLIIGFEGLLLSLYISYFPHAFPPLLTKAAEGSIYLFAPAFLYKQFINLLQLANSGMKLVTNVKPS